MSRAPRFTVDGHPVPSVTQVIGILNKPALLNWAYKTGVEAGTNNMDYNLMQAIQTRSKNIGSYAHAMIHAFLAHEDVEQMDISNDLKDEGAKCFTKFQKWFVDVIEAQGDGEAKYTEQAFTHDTMEFGGKVDAVFSIAGKNVLVDFKTSSMIADDNWIQLAAYAELLVYNSIPIQKVAVLRLPKDDSPYEYVERDVTDVRIMGATEVFYNLLSAFIHLKSMKVKP